MHVLPHSKIRDQPLTCTAAGGLEAGVFPQIFGVGVAGDAAHKKYEVSWLGITVIPQLEPDSSRDGLVSTILFLPQKVLQFCVGVYFQ